jgi:hypothetical protein
MEIAELAKQFYEKELKHSLDVTRTVKFVAIEPSSKSYFLGETFVEAVLAAKATYPERQSFVLKIGQLTAFHLGALK